MTFVSAIIYYSRTRTCSADPNEGELRHGWQEDPPVLGSFKPYGVQVATLNPGAYRTGFNDTGMESMDQWWEDGKQVMQPRVKRPLNNQHDPQEMIDAIIDVITAASHPYRTVRPQSAGEMVRREQAEEWDVIV